MATARKRRLFTVAGLLAALGVAVAAYAYWTATGSGAGSGTTAAPGAQTVTVNQTSTVTGLYPGGSAALSGDFDNAADNAVRVSSVDATVTGTDQAGCTAADYQVTGTAAIANGGSVPSGSGVGGWSGLTITMLDTASDQDACKGATVDISYTAS